MRDLCNQQAEESWPFGVDDVIRAACAPRRLSMGPKANWLGLLSIIDAGERLSRAERHRYAVELEYARRHRIPVELISGFIWQVGGAKRISRLADNDYEPWFDASRHTAEAFIATSSALPD